MGKIFRLHDTGNNTLQGWDNSAQYNANVIIVCITIYYVIIKE